jgi:hypothetical protein
VFSDVRSYVSGTWTPASIDRLGDDVHVDTLAHLLERRTLFVQRLEIRDIVVRWCPRVSELRERVSLCGRLRFNPVLARWRLSRLDRVRTGRLGVVGSFSFECELVVTPEGATALQPTDAGGLR